MKFKAENFEATATEVLQDHFVVQVSGDVARSIKLESYAWNRDYGAWSLWFLSVQSGWQFMAPIGVRELPDDSPGVSPTAALATAIAVLYSVPGVVCVEESAP